MLSATRLSRGSFLANDLGAFGHRVQAVLGQGPSRRMAPLQAGLTIENLALFAKRGGRPLVLFIAELAGPGLWRLVGVLRKLCDDVLQSAVARQRVDAAFTDEGALATKEADDAVDGLLAVLHDVEEDVAEAGGAHVAARTRRGADDTGIGLGHDAQAVDIGAVTAGGAAIAAATAATTTTATAHGGARGVFGAHQGVRSAWCAHGVAAWQQERTLEPALASRTP